MVDLIQSRNYPGQNKHKIMKTVMSKTVMSKNVASIGIQKHFGSNMELEILGSTGNGDSKMILYRAMTGQEVIETNGDPCWDSEDGFQAARDQIMGAE